MKSKLLGCMAAIALGAAFGFVTPVMAFHGGGGFHGGGFGGMHGGGGLAGMRGGGMFLGNGGFHGGLQGSMSAGRGTAFAPGVHRFGGATVGFRHNLAFRHVGFHNRHFRNVAFFGAPFFHGDFYGDGCWRRVWTSYGWQWANLCGDYGY